MGDIAVAGSLSGAAVATWCLELGIVDSVAAVTQYEYDILKRSPAGKRAGDGLALISDETQLVAWLRRRDSDTVISLFSGPMGALLATEDKRLIAVTAPDPTASASFDVLSTAIAAGHEAAMQVIESKSGNRIRTDQLTIPTRNDNLGQLSKTVAEFIGGHDADTVDQANGPDDLDLGIGRSLPLTLADRTLDWNKPADELERTVRAFALPGSEAATSYEGVEVFIASATVSELAAPVARPGLVIAVEPEQILVSTGQGVLGVSGVRDRIGPLETRQIRVGSVLGGDLRGELSSLEQRVLDLEHIVWCLTRERDFLSRGPE